MYRQAALRPKSGSGEDENCSFVALPLRYGAGDGVRPALLLEI
ncbi:MAG: hypothetical protein ACPLSP_05605 [Fervidicoccus fontis]